MRLRQLLGLEEPKDVLTDRKRLKEVMSKNAEAAEVADGKLIDLLRRTNEDVIASKKKSE